MNRRIVNLSSEGKIKTYSSDRPTKRTHTIEEYVLPEKTPFPRPDSDSIPLELAPTIRTLKGYGRRMNALGALRVARSLEKVVDSIMPHINKYPELVDIVLQAKNEADSIRTEAQRGASFEQDDPEDGEDL